jgi:hypothetical protein
MEMINEEYAKRRLRAWKKNPSLDGYRPSEPWHDDPATSMQLSRLDDHDVSWDGDLTQGEALYLYCQCFPPGKMPVSPEEDDDWGLQ